MGATRQELSGGFYSLVELTRLISYRTDPTSVPTVLRWVKDGLVASGHQEGHATYSFYDLVSLLVVSRLRAAGVKLAAIRTAEEHLRKTEHISRPFATRMLYTDGVDVLYRANPAIEHQRTAANRVGPEVLEKTLPETLRGVRYMDDVAAWWDIEPTVRLHPDIQFGEPCIPETRLPTAQLFALNNAGESPQKLSRLYEKPLEDVQAAIRFERRLLEAAKT